MVGTHTTSSCLPSSPRTRCGAGTHSPFVVPGKPGTQGGRVAVRGYHLFDRPPQPPHPVFPGRRTPSSPTQIGDPGGRGYHPNPQTHQTPSHPNHPRRGRSRTALRTTGNAATPTHTPPPSSPTQIGDPGGRGYHPNPQNHQTPSHSNTLRGGGFQTRLGGTRGAASPSPSCLSSSPRTPTRGRYPWWGDGARVEKDRLDIREHPSPPHTTVDTGIRQ